MMIFCGYAPELMQPRSCVLICTVLVGVICLAGSILSFTRSEILCPKIRCFEFALTSLDLFANGVVLLVHLKFACCKDITLLGFGKAVR